MRTAFTVFFFWYLYNIKWLPHLVAYLLHFELPFVFKKDKINCTILQIVCSSLQVKSVIIAKLFLALFLK